VFETCSTTSHLPRPSSPNVFIIVGTGKARACRDRDSALALVGSGPWLTASGRWLAGRLRRHASALRVHETDPDVIRFPALLALLSCWYRRSGGARRMAQSDEAIMGTGSTSKYGRRCSQVAKAIDAVMATCGASQSDEPLQARESALPDQRTAAQEPVQSIRAVHLINCQRITRNHRGRLRHHLRECRPLYDYPNHIRPTEEQIKAALPGVNWRNMLFDPAHTIKSTSGDAYHLGGIGKGYAVDRGIAICRPVDSTRAGHAGGDRGSWRSHGAALAGGHPQPDDKKQGRHTHPDS